MEWPAKGTGTQLHTSAGFFKVHQTNINPSVTTLIFNRTAFLLCIASTHLIACYSCTGKPPLFGKIVRIIQRIRLKPVRVTIKI
ncbi:MAG: hypothetical protein Q7J23_04935 [Nitrosomonas sp.]|nr:hypothetical protein [Nitrosomonas sp.]